MEDTEASDKPFPRALSKSEAIAWARSRREAGEPFEATVLTLKQNGWSDKVARLVVVAALSIPKNPAKIPTARPGAPTIDYTDSLASRAPIRTGPRLPDVTASNTAAALAGLLLMLIGIWCIVFVMRKGPLDDMVDIGPAGNPYWVSKPEVNVPYYWGTIGFPAGLVLFAGGVIGSRGGFER